MPTCNDFQSFHWWRSAVIINKGPSGNLARKSICSHQALNEQGLNEREPHIFRLRMRYHPTSLIILLLHFVLEVLLRLFRSRSSLP